MTLALAVYLLAGAVMIAQGLYRNRKYRTWGGIADVIFLTGVLALWPLVLAAEVYCWWDERQFRNASVEADQHKSPDRAKEET